MTRGFTLVELVVTLGVFGLIMIVGSDFLIQTIRNSNQAVIQNEVRQNASVILQDMIAQARRAYCIYYESPTPPPPPPPTYTNTALLRLSDDPNGTRCASGNQVEYYQDQNGIVTRTAIDSAGTQTSTGVLTSLNSTVLNCDSGGSACGFTNPNSCAAGLVVTSNGSPITAPVINGTQVTIAIRSQQIPGQIKSEFCAAVALSNTVTPRVR